MTCQWSLITTGKYIIFSKKKNVDFKMPKPFFHNQKFNFYVMEYIKSINLFNYIKQYYFHFSDYNNIDNILYNVGDMLLQYHNLIRNNEMVGKNIFEHESLKWFPNSNIFDGSINKKYFL